MDACGVVDQVRSSNDDIICPTFWEYNGPSASDLALVLHDSRPPNEVGDAGRCQGGAIVE